MGKYTKKLIDDYTVIDTETTGLSAYYDEVIEIGMLKVRNNEIVDRYSQLISPKNEINLFITQLTGITNEMVRGMPGIDDIKNEVLSFIDDDIIVGHNTNFDIRFLESGFGIKLENYYMDTMQFSRKVYPELSNHRLSDMSDFLNLTNNEHRALADCITTKELYDAIKTKMKADGVSISDLWHSHRHYQYLDVESITATGEVNEDSFFYGRHVVFTGTLKKLSRREAMQIVVDQGGVLDKSVTKHTNLLILGDNTYNSILHGEKSSKQKKAEKLKLDGQDIEILDELTFYDIINHDKQEGNNE